MRERETQELLKMGTAGADKKKRTGKGHSIFGSKAFAQNVAAEKVQMYGQVSRARRHGRAGRGGREGAEAGRGVEEERLEGGTTDTNVKLADQY